MKKYNLIVVGGGLTGVAAAVAVEEGTTPHGVNIRKVQDILVDQDVPLPRNEKFAAKDPTYQECVEAHEYGLYTEPAKKARENKDATKTYRHWTLSAGSGDPNKAH